ncbi:MAG: stimulus-sensing domain-containing protein [Alphaproteobacteria bacterium]|nr:stimulus-sensing domain-containing protein [Alphaproteobacteria bacterium]
MSAPDAATAKENKQSWTAWLRGLIARGDIARPRGLSLRPRRRWLSALAAQVLVFNIFALIFFIAGVSWVQSARVSLVEERVKSLKAQAEIVAAALARYAAKGVALEDEDSATDVDPDKAATVLNLLVGPTGMRARIFSRDGRPVQDTRFILTRNQVTVQPLPPPGQIDLLNEVEKKVKQSIYAMRPAKDLAPVVNDDPQLGGQTYEEVRSVLERGEAGSAERINAEGNLIVSVAVPIRRLQFIMGVLMLSTEAGDIDDVLRQEWLQLLLAALIASVIFAAATVFLLLRITRPVRALADGADAVRRGERQLDALPNLGRRGDEIGDLSVALRSMTAALYARMDTIEQFAADVAHEIKNPLTSVASAIETLQRTNEEDKRRKLMSVVRDDVRRLDRLITDISDASRLDAELSRERARDVDLGGLIPAMAQMFEDPDKPDKPRFKLDMPVEGLVVRGLDGPLAQVFRNVIENAVSFSPKGGEIRITAAPSNGRAVVTIDDQGPGIPEENLEAIFRRFYTERPASHGFGKNSGLGLSISRQIVEVHGGHIVAANLRDADGVVRGARFTIDLPLMQG